jgi:hypothetical protein
MIFYIKLVVLQYYDTTSHLCTSESTGGGLSRGWTYTNEGLPQKTSGVPFWVLVYQFENRWF